ncbi:phage repressor protein [Mergibacter septicus]|uniref:LexA family transcriptional regulator n=1 Tax=Mergibacter septicus TaxID=221402 RepID=UPI0011794EC9|nr:LexA family transcriptional regulator [Mergibacter septicus]AWX14239.1 phage repressor protein [Mergibacter septicus]
MQCFNINDKKQKKQKNDDVSFNEQQKETTFPKRLQSLIGNETLRAFSKKIGISYSSLHKYINGQAQPTLDNLLAIAQHTNTDMNWLVFGEGTQEKNSCNRQETENDTKEYCCNSEKEEKNSLPVKYIRDCREIAISAGNGTINDNESGIEVRKLPVEEQWFIDKRINPDNCILLSVKGDSMYPVLIDGQDIIVDTSKNTDLIEGKIYVINNNGTNWVKKIHRTINGIKLTSENPQYKDIEINENDCHGLKIIGQVVRGHKNF